jgi:hypothetical protein
VEGEANASGRAAQPAPAARARLARWFTLPTLGLLLVGLGACGGKREVPIQNAKVGDPLVEVEGTRVDLAQDFQTGVSNGLYKGAVRLTGPDHPADGSLHALNVVCSLPDTPGWPPYDNLYGYPIRAVAEARNVGGEKRWQILYHFDGRIEGTGSLKPQAWMSRLKDNLCRRGDFDDAKATRKSGD